MDFDTYERAGRQLYAECARTIAAIIEKVAEGQADYRIQQVQHRAKGVASLKKKLEARNVTTPSQIESEVKDLAGVRVVLYTNADVIRFISSGIIGGNFDVDWDRTKFHYPMKEPTADDGFISYNYVVRLKADRLALPEYRALAGLSCEVQVQTTLDHAWSEMAHDTIYKPPPPGFGSAAMKSVAERMAAIMQKYLRPAGFEFQKVVADVRDFERARAVAEQNPLLLIAQAADNNERHDRLEEFSQTLGYYDDLADLVPQFVYAVVQAVKAARATPTAPRVALGMSFEGVSQEAVLANALQVIDQLRFVSVESIDATFEALVEIYSTAPEAERDQILKSVEGIARHNRDVWAIAGPIAQQRLVAAIEAFDNDKRLALEPLVVETLHHVLRADVRGTSSTYNAVTLHMGAVPASDDYLKARHDALSILEAILLASGRLLTQRQILQAFDAAGRLPDRGTVTPELLGAVLSDTIRVVRFMTAHVLKLPYEIQRQYEHQLLWRYRNSVALPPNHKEDATLEAKRIELRSAVLKYRDTVNSNEDYVTYKTLIGYDSVFPPSWESDGTDIKSDAAYREQAVSELVREVSEATSDRWLQIINLCKQAENMRGDSCIGFRSFLVGLSQKRPDLLEQLFGQLDQELEPFIAALLQGLEGGPHGAIALAWPHRWIAEGKYLGEVIAFLHVSKTPRPDLLASACSAAIAVGDDDAVGSAMGAAARRHAEAPATMLATFLSGLAYFTGKSSTAWTEHVWLWARRDEFLDHLDAPVRSRILDNLIHAPKINFQLEELLRDVAAPTPADLLPFFNARLAQADAEARSRRFEAMPFTFHGLGEAFNSIPRETVAAVREWFAAAPSHSLFEHGAGALIARAYPDFSSVAAPLQELVSRGAEGDIEFVLRVLMGYKGEPAIMPTCREIVACLDDEDPLLGMVETALDQSDIVAGDFGLVERYQQRKTEIAPLLLDSSPRVRAFAERRNRRLDLRIAAEQRRSLEELELRKRGYGE